MAPATQQPQVKGVPGGPAAPGESGVGAPPIPVNRYVLAREVHRFFPRLTDTASHPTRWDFPAFLDRSVPWVGVLRDLYEWPASFPASFSPEAGLLLHSLVRNIRPRTVVEVGSFLGVSTIWMAAAMEASEKEPGQAPVAPGQPRGIIHAFDDFGPMAKGPWREVELPESRLPIIRESLRRAGLEHRVVLHPGNSPVEIEQCQEALRGPGPAHPGPGHTGGVDFALIDGDHSIKGVLADLWAVEPVLNTGGYVLLHDTFPEQCGDHEGPRHAIDHIRGVAQGLYEVCELYTVPLNYGMALLRRVG
ncbi:MAG: class I SAM-dependent methyltransferase [Phycisphaerales bacterium]